MIFYQILSTTSLKKCIEISLENWYVDIGTQTERVKSQKLDQHYGS